MAKKTWSSLPKSDFLNMNRQNSVGSLDRNFSGGVGIYVILKNIHVVVYTYPFDYTRFHVH